MTVQVTKMTSKGQVVIPQEIREGKGIKPGERFIIYDINDNIVLKRVRNLESAKTIDDFEKTFRSMWNTAKAVGATKADVEDEIAAYRKEALKHNAR